MIFISTGGYYERSAYESARELIANGFFNIELSGGQFSESLHQDLLKLKGQACLQIHNYFPPPRVPFVFNLGSLNIETADAAMQHARKAITWAADFSQPVYSFHAGFLLDPAPKELGRRIGKRELFDRETSLEKFISRVNELAEFSRDLGVELLVENNVLSHSNYKEFGENPLLMVTPDEAVRIMESTLSNVNMLVDVAHLKVSARTLGFDPISMFTKCQKWIHAYHLSDNDGLSDSNQEVREDSWFWEHLQRDLKYYSLEIYKTDLDHMKRQFALTQKKLGLIE